MSSMGDRHIPARNALVLRVDCLVMGISLRAHQLSWEWDRPLSGWNELSAETREEMDSKCLRDCTPWPPSFSGVSCNRARVQVAGCLVSRD